MIRFAPGQIDVWRVLRSTAEDGVRQVVMGYFFQVRNACNLALRINQAGNGPAVVNGCRALLLPGGLILPAADTDSVRPQRCLDDPSVRALPDR
ncbi:hypothetical protein AMJ57_00720 [Parcubacteria bacterium SG8_24]|nr:MAG: hypothetical protein AMJ57_00720 [Parcubacteria bacterium SG8_24]